ncbi:RNA polymerase sigma factor [uncultured Gimesia sp.]|uniref:RNA polymerase sigma factor n=1 Tax=uncultured Gimesia sp. TaxID=1678688 RepID=UPI0026264F83|nr:RNA polymerase sigma factor [uncultured Gimesia sp.]
MIDDATIMKRICAGEYLLFDELVLRYRDRLLRFAWSKYGNISAAEDLVQEAFLSAFAARDSYNPEFAFSTWLWTIFLNLCRRHYKRELLQPREIVRSSFAAADSTKIPEPSSSETPLQVALKTEQFELLAVYLSELSEVQADALRLRFFGGMKFSEIALTMDCSLSAAKIRVKNGLLKLAHRFSEGKTSEGDVS